MHFQRDIHITIDTLFLHWWLTTHMAVNTYSELVTVIDCICELAQFKGNVFYNVSKLQKKNNCFPTLIFDTVTFIFRHISGSHFFRELCPMYITCDLYILHLLYLCFKKQPVYGTGLNKFWENCNLKGCSAFWKNYHITFRKMDLTLFWIELFNYEE